MANVRYPGTAGTTPGTIAASDVTYDNTTSGLTADDVQEAIDEVDGNLDTLSGKVYKTDDSTETTIASDDLLPIYDTSATAAKKITVANVVSGTVSNLNLVDNAWFTVNQRGLSQYTFNSFSNHYTVDRWALGRNNFTVDVTDNGLSITAIADASNNVEIRNTILHSDLKGIDGKTITVSAIVDGVLYSASAVVDLSSDTSWVNIPIGDPANLIYLQTRNLPNDSKVNIRFLFGKVNTQRTIVVKAVKMEVGSVSTLAMDTAPNYATELLKCQRYFERIKGEYAQIGMGIFTGTSLFNCIIKYQAKRVTPVATLSGTIYCWDIDHQGSSGFQSTSLNSTALSDIGSGALIFSTSGASKGNTGLAQIRDSATYIDLSADL